MGLRTIREGVGLGNQGQGPRESDSGQHCRHGLPASMSWPAAPWLPPLPDLACPGTALASACQAWQPHLWAQLTGWSIPLVWYHWPDLPSPVALLENGTLWSTSWSFLDCIPVWGSAGPSHTSDKHLYSFPSYLRCFLLQEAFPDSPPLFHFHRQFAAPYCKFP